MTISVVLQDACLMEIADLRACAEWVMYENDSRGGELSWNTTKNEKEVHLFF